ncbi:hypothetical protein LP419_39575 [Massilia sp. H-1]|nr:hypothetical protein LP419_39575 [Massilia sp. H-1]
MTPRPKPSTWAPSHGYSTGDEVTYRMDPGGSVVNGLTDGQKYFLRISGDKASMYDTEDHANAGGATGRVDLVAAPAATGTAHGFEESGGPTGTGVGIAVAVNVANVTNEAILGDSTITADGVVVKAMMADVGGDTENTFSASATSGSSGADTGVAGALAINVGISRAQGKIANNASLTLNADGNTEVRAENEVANTVKASGKQTGGGGVGVGASIALNIVETDTDALIGDNVSFSGAGDITLSADSVDKVETTAEGGSAGDTAVTPVVAISVSDNDTHAEVQGGGVLTLGGTLDASATHEGRIYTDAAGDTESGDTGVGISIALTIGNDNAIATTGRDITMRRRGPVPGTQRHDQPRLGPCQRGGRRAGRRRRHLG